MYKLIWGFILVILVFIPAGVIIIFSSASAEDNPVEITPALNKINLQLKATGVLTEDEANKIMAEVKTEFQRMAGEMLQKKYVDGIATQACHIIKTAAKNAGELQKLAIAVAFMAEECKNGNNPGEVGKMLCHNFKKCKDMEKSIKQTQERLRQRERDKEQAQTRQRQQDQTSSGSGSSNGGGGSGNSGQGRGRK